MLSFVLQKLRSKKWMIISLLLGNLLMVAIAAAGPMYSEAALQRTLTRDLSNYLVEVSKDPGTIVAGGEYKTTSKVNEETFLMFAEGDARFDALLEELDVPQLQRVTHLSRPGTNAVPEIKVDGGKNSLTMRISTYSDVEDHIQLMTGEMYSPEIRDGIIDVIVNERTFVEQELLLGGVLELSQVKDENGTPYRIRIAGIFENKLEQDPYWISSPANWTSACLVDEAVFREIFVNPEKMNRNFTAEWYAVLDYTEIRGDQVGHYLDVLERYQEVYEEIDVELTASFQNTLLSFVPEFQKLNTTIWVLLLPVFVLLATFIFMVSRQMLELEQNEISVYKSRGANKGQIVQLYLLQSLCISGASFVGGIPLGMLMCSMLGASNSFLEFVHRTAMPLEIGGEVLLVAGLAALFSVCTMVLPVFRYANVGIVDHKRKKNRVGKMPWWQLVFLDVVLLGVSVYGLYQYNGQKEYLSQKVLDGAALDPLLYICSSLFMVGAALLILRLFPWILRLVFQVGKKWWSPSLYASFLRIIRTRSNQGFIMVFMILTVALGIYNAQAARTINSNAEERIYYSNGADLVLQEAWSTNEESLAMLKALGESTGDGVMYSEPDFDKYRTMEGVKSATRVLVDKKITATVDKGKIKNVILMGIHTKEFGETAWFKESLLPAHYHEYLNAISQNSLAILVSSNFRDDYGYEIGDILYYSNENKDSQRGIIYGFVDYWPTYAPFSISRGEDGNYSETEQYLIVAHLAQLQSAWGVTPYQVWIDAEDSTQFIYDHAAESGVLYTHFSDAAAELIDLKNDPVFQGTNGILTIGFICVLLLCTIGFLIYWILSIQSRTLQFGIFRAMGMTMKEVFAMLICEQVCITGVSIASGILVGVFTSKLFVPLIQIAYSSADQVIPLEIVSVAGDYVRLFAVIGFVMLACMVILCVLISKIKISQALKLGED